MPIPLSFAQQRFWIMNQLDPNNTGYNVKTALQVHGPLDVKVFEEAVTELFAHNEVLRTTYASTDGIPVQVIRPAERVTVEVITVSEGGKKEAVRLAAAAATKPFNLAAGPVCRFHVYRLGAEDHIVLMASHHICMDG